MWSRDANSVDCGLKALYLESRNTYAKTRLKRQQNA